jgi:hypothetical protein
MLEVRKNLRKVATIVACLAAVTVMFAACGKTNPDDGNDGNIDKKIIGQWSCIVLDHTYVYQFNADGTYYQYTTWSTYMNSITGKFQTTGDVVYLTELVLHYSLGDYGEQQEPLKDKNSKYSFGTNAQYNTNYLEIRVFSTNDNNPDSETLYKFYKYK